MSNPLEEIARHMNQVHQSMHPKGCKCDDCLKEDEVDEEARLDKIFLEMEQMYDRLIGLTKNVDKKLEAAGYDMATKDEMVLAVWHQLVNSYAKLD